MLFRSVHERAAQEKLTVEVDKFYLARVTVDQGPVLKRFRARSMGRAAPIRKRSSHLQIVLREKKWGRK